MNLVETAVVNSRARRAVQRWYKVPALQRLAGRAPGAQALKVGCGSGNGSRLALDQFGAATLDAVDPTPRWSRARRALRRYADQVRVEPGAATDLQRGQFLAGLDRHGYLLGVAERTTATPGRNCRWHSPGS